MSNREQEHYTDLVNAYAHYGAADLIGKVIEVIRNHITENTVDAQRLLLNSVCYKLRDAQNIIVDSDQ